MVLLDLIIIGAGPAGMTAAIYARRKGLSLQLIAESIGGQVSRTGDVENYPGYERIPGPQLVSRIKEQLEGLKVDIRLSRVTGIEHAVAFKVSTADGSAFEARSVIVASGSKWKELNVPGEQEFRNKGVSYCTTCDGPLFAGMDVAVVGGGNSAAEAVFDLVNYCPRVYMVVRSSLKADKVMVDRINANSKVTVFTGYTVESVSGKDFVDSVVIVSKGGDRQTLKVGGIFVEVGQSPNVSFVKGLAALNERGEIVVDDYCRTNVTGLFACGDVTDVPQKQIIIAAGEGAKAAMSAFTYISSLK